MRANKRSISVRLMWQTTVIELFISDGEVRLIERTKVDMCVWIQDLVLGFASSNNLEIYFYPVVGKLALNIFFEVVVMEW